MSKHSPTETAQRPKRGSAGGAATSHDPAPGRSVVVLDGTYRGEIGRVMSSGGGMVWVKIAGVDELLGLPLASVETSRARAPKSRDVPTP